MAITDGGMQKESTLMESAGKVLDLASSIDEKMSEFLEGGRPPETAENKPQPVLATLNAVKDRLDRAVYRLESIDKQFHIITNKIA